MTPDLISNVWHADRPPRLSAGEWETLLGQARAMRLSARLAMQFRQPGWDAAVPPRVKQHLHNSLRIAAALRRSVEYETVQLAHAMRPLDVPVVLLKGAAYVAADLPAARGRLFSDIDLLVPRDRLRDVELALMGAGWVAERLAPYDDRYYRNWMHELPPMRHVQRQSHIDVHHTLAPPTSRFVIDGADMLARSVPVAASAANAPQLRILAPADMVLHSALHLMQEGEFHSGLRDLLDIRDLLQHYGQAPDFWAALVSRARALGLEGVLAQVVGQLQRLFDFTPPPDWPEPVFARTGAVVQFMLSKVLNPPDAAGDSFVTRLARHLMYVRSHWLRMPWYQIVPHISRKALARIAHRIGGPTT